MPVYTADPRIDPACRKAADRYLKACRGLEDRSAWSLKIFTAVNIFYWHLDAFDRPEDPRPGFIAKFNEASELIERAHKFCVGAFPPVSEIADENDFETRISGLFGDVWVGLSDDVYFDQSHEFLVKRFALNDIDAAAFFKDKVVVDAGCGSGKFAAAIAKLGAKKVIGLDIGEKGLDFARAQAAKVPYGDRLEYRRSSLLNIDLASTSVDIVWSNGVIHHTSDYERCLAEFARVIRPGGHLYLYVEGPEGLFELMCDTFVAAHITLPRALVQHLLTRLGINTGRIYWIMDCLFAPYERKSPEEVERLLRKYGFGDIKHLARGLPIDNNEMVATGQPYAATKHGNGMLKYIARKLA